MTDEEKPQSEQCTPLSLKAGHKRSYDVSQRKAHRRKSSLSYLYNCKRASSYCPSDHIKYRLYGRIHTELSLQPNSVLVALAKLHGANYKFMKLLLEIEELYLANPYPREKLAITITTLYRCLNEEDMHSNLLDNSSLLSERANAYQLVNGTEIIKKAVMYDSIAYRTDEENKDVITDKAKLIECLYKLVSLEHSLLGEKVAKDLATDPDFILQLMRYLTIDITYITASKLLEDVMEYGQTLRLSQVPFFEELIESFDPPKLASFCKIISILVSDAHTYDANSLVAQNEIQRRPGYVDPREFNQDILLRIPSLTKKLIKVILDRDYAPRFRLCVSEIENWMQHIDNSASDAVDGHVDIYDHSADLSFTDELLASTRSFIAGVSAPSNNLEQAHWEMQSSLLSVKVLTDKVESIYATSLLLTGKHRARAQKQFAEAGLAPAMSELFDNFIWTVNHAQIHRAQGFTEGHYNDCECSPEVALKIQFLRLVHGFCDHSDYKRLLLSPIELGEIKRINNQAGILKQTGLDSMHSAMQCKGKEGLLSKLVEKFKGEAKKSSFRFWIARAIESYLRGRTSFCEQIFLLRRGLLQFIIHELLDMHNELNYMPQSQKLQLQSSFDLLGELCRFNIESFKIIDDVLKDETSRQRFMKVVDYNLVDSNMFLRASILSYFFFNYTYVEYKAYSKHGNYILRHVSDPINQIKYLHRMIANTKVSTITQENVSCLNTTLVFLMTARREGKLADYVTMLFSEVEVDITERVGGKRILNNFRELLLFWKDHYLGKGRDGSVLEQSTRIDFSEWTDTMSTLLAENDTIPTSISFYIGNKRNDRSQ